MTPVDQTIFVGDVEGRPGNCMQAAVASILGLPLDAVPHFAAMPADEGDSWPCWDAFDSFFDARGFEAVRLDYEFCPESFYLASGPSPRGVSHMVVMRDGKLAHDPHPSRAGISKVESVWLLLARDAERFVAR